MAAIDKKNESRGFEDLGYKVGIGLLFCQQSVSCVYTEINAFRFRCIPRNHTAAAAVLFYPGLYLAWRRLYTWTDEIYERQKLRRREALASVSSELGFVSQKNMAALPKSPRELGYMSPQWAPGLFALLAMNLRGRRVQRAGEFNYQVWAPHSRVGAILFHHVQRSILSTSLIGAASILACRTMWDWKQETDRYERTL